MSLINDALKRAKQVQKENPPPTPPLQFRPPEPAQEGHPRSPLLVVGVALGLTVVVGLGGLLLWAAAQQRAASLQAEARTLEQVAPSPTALAKGETTPASVTSPEEAQTNSLPAVVMSEPPKAPELKLQGILFNPGKPSAVVNSRTVYMGDRVNGFRVIAITARSVTLVTSTETNVLSLSE